MQRFLVIVKVVTTGAFLMTLFPTYYLREEVLKLNEIRFSAANADAEERLENVRKSYPDRVKSYEVQVQNYELQKKHYDEMLALYESDYDAYVQRLEDKFQPPKMPYPPQKPTPPDEQDEQVAINAQFRAQQFHYFRSSLVLNWIVCGSALVLTGGLLLLIFFEPGAQRFAYLAVLMVSFVFMIGPSFHSIMSAIVGFLRPPNF